MSIFTETEPKPEGWVAEEVERNLKEKIGDELYQWLENETKKVGHSIP